MAENDFSGSIAQNNLIYSISTTLQTVPGQNYYTPMIFLGSATSGDDNLVDPPVSFPTIINVTNSNFADLTKGTLLAWLTSYFAVNNSLSTININVYDSTVSSYGGVTTAFNAFKTLSYQKFIFEVGSSSAAKIALGVLCAADTLTSQFWTETDSDSLTVPLSTGISYDLANHSPPIEAVEVYSAQVGPNAALTACGLMLATLNASGTPVGNGVDYNATLAVLASGTTGGSDNSNLTATQIANAITNNVLFYRTVGNGTGQVAIQGDVTSLGNFVGVEWFEDYLQYISQVDGATYLTSAPPKTKVEPTYNGLLAILQNNAYPFTQGDFPVISNFVLTAYPFSRAPASAGNTFVITGPLGYAWQANFNRKVEFATVTGNLVVQA